MAKRILTQLVFSLAFFITPSWAATNAVCTPGDGFIACQFVQGTTNVTGTFDFGVDGVISFQFDSILASFELDVSAVEDAPVSFSGTDFPAGTVCIPYNGTGGNGGHCVRYNVTGTPFPVKGVNFSGLITVLLNYSSFSISGIPAFGHAPGDTTTAPFSEDILTFYVDPNASNCTNSCGGDPGMGGKIPGISSFEAFKKPFAPPVPTNGYTVCNTPPTSSGLTASFQNSTSGNNPIVEVSFVLAASGSNCTGGPFLRDKTATLSVGVKDPTTGNVTPQPLVNGGDSNKFHFNNQTGANVQDINTNGLQSGTTYQVTVISLVFSPVSTTFTIP
jgi:hypothetical protein